MSIKKKVRVGATVFGLLAAVLCFPVTFAYASTSGSSGSDSVYSPSSVTYTSPGGSSGKTVTKVTQYTVIGGGSCGSRYIGSYHTKYLKIYYSDGSTKSLRL